MPSKNVVVSFFLFFLAPLTWLKSRQISWSRRFSPFFLEVQRIIQWFTLRHLIIFFHFPLFFPPGHSAQVGSLTRRVTYFITFSPSLLKFCPKINPNIFLGLVQSALSPTYTSAFGFSSAGGTPRWRILQENSGFSTFSKTTPPALTFWRRISSLLFKVFEPQRTSDMKWVQSGCSAATLSLTQTASFKLPPKMHCLCGGRGDTEASVAQVWEVKALKNMPEDSTPIPLWKLSGSSSSFVYRKFANAILQTCFWILPETQFLGARVVGRILGLCVFFCFASRYFFFLAVAFTSAGSVFFSNKKSPVTALFYVAHVTTFFHHAFDQFKGVLIFLIWTEFLPAFFFHASSLFKLCPETYRPYKMQP